MVDILKITSPVSIKNKVQNLPSKLPTDAVFDIQHPNQVNTKVPKTKETLDEGEKQSLLRNLNKEIFEPLLNSTKSQAEGLRKLVLMAKVFEGASGTLPESFLDKVFVSTKDMLGELLSRERGATIFTGDFFDSLRMLAKLEGQPKLKEAIVSILKYFDCYVNQKNSLNAIVSQGQNLMQRLPKAEGQLLAQQMDVLDSMIKLSALSNQESEGDGGVLSKQNSSSFKESMTEIKSFLKNQLIPLLGNIAKNHQGSEKIYNLEMTMIHNIVRFDKSDASRLEEAIFQLGDELKPLTNLSDDDVVDMKKLVFEQAKIERELLAKGNLDKSLLDKFGIDLKEEDVTTLLANALDKSTPGKINSLAQNMLLNLVQNESPLMALIHFTIPFRYQDENTYGEFFVDKDCKERRGDAQTAQNIFFTIQSDQFGTFEVDLLAKDKRIELDIRCPDRLLPEVKEAKGSWKEMIEAEGYKLLKYQAAVYQESQSIMHRFPKLVFQKVGIDVKV